MRKVFLSSEFLACWSFSLLRVSTLCPTHRSPVKWMITTCVLNVTFLSGLCLLYVCAPKSIANGSVRCSVNKLTLYFWYLHYTFGNTTPRASLILNLVNRSHLQTFSIFYNTYWTKYRKLGNSLYKKTGQFVIKINQNPNNLYKN